MCGCCCRGLDDSKVHAELDRGDGVCRYLDGNLCSIYEDRPQICRVDELYDLLYKNSMTWEEYNQLQYEVCKRLKEQDRSN